MYLLMFSSALLPIFEISHAVKAEYTCINDSVYNAIIGKIFIPSTERFMEDPKYSFLAFQSSHIFLLIWK